MRVRLTRRLDRKLNFLSYENKLRVGSIDRPDYGWPLPQAAWLARKLNYPAISAVEFGVVGGNGLVALERHAETIEQITGVRIDVYGFDAGTGLPSPIDYRDMPYLWEQGYYKMDIEALQRPLKRARLVLGDVRETVPALDCRGAFHEFGGELLAIREFNARHESIKIECAHGAQVSDQMTWSMEKL